MKQIVTVRATEDITRYVGDVALEAKGGDVLALNPKQAEIALALGGFELVSVEDVTDEAPAVASNDAGDADSNAAADVASNDAPAKRKKKTSNDETAPADEKADTETTEE